MPSPGLGPPLLPPSIGSMGGYSRYSESSGSNTHTILLVRPDKTRSGSFGFSIRGGLEHRLGIYVSEVEVGSEAHLQGLQVGDQVVRVCGMSVSHSTLKEVVTVIQNRTKIQLKVSSGSMIPVRNVKGEPVTWQMVQPPPVQEITKEDNKDKIDERINIECEGNRGEESDCIEQSLVINLQGQQGLGCSICKGPVEKPGIFIQSTKAGRLAREVGLRPGDQILECNNTSFRNIEFGDAVFHLKSSRQLNLLIRKRAGLELFPSELSSGYDSSASSSVGGDSSNTDSSIDQAVLPPIKRPPDPPPIRTSTPQNKINSDDNSGDNKESDFEKQRQKLISEQNKLRQEARALSAERRKFEEEKQLLHSTIGKSNSGVLSGSKSVSDLLDVDNTFNKTNPQMGGRPSSGASVAKSPSSLSSDYSTSDSSGSLAAALQSEIKRRASRSQTGSVKSTTTTESMKPKSQPNSFKKGPLIAEKNDQHDLLIAEFKKAHKKMFSSSPDISEEDKVEDIYVEEDKVTEIKNIESMAKPNVPPPPPLNKTLYSTPYTPSSSSSESLSTMPMTSFKPVIPPKSNIPGIPTPDYDRSPNKTPPPPNPRKLKYNKNRICPGGGKHIVPPTVEGIHRAKSLSSLTNIDLEENTHPRLSQKLRAPIPAPSLRSSESISDIRSTHLSLKSSIEERQLISDTSRNPSTQASSKKPYSKQISAPIPFSKTRISGNPSNSLTDTPPGMFSRVSSNTQPEFMKRHPDIEQVTSMESFQVSLEQQPQDLKPPAIYFDSESIGSVKNNKSGPLVTIQSYSSGEQREPTKFEFLPKPCDPSTLPVKKQGEEARIASKDYRTINLGQPTRPGLIKSSEQYDATQRKAAQHKQEQTKMKIAEKHIRSFGVKKAPAPMPPILRKF